MRKSLLRRPSPAGLVAFVALLLALGGTAYAGSTLGKNSVGSKQLKNGAVTNGKLANSAVGTAKLKNGAVTSSKLNTSGLTVPNALHASSAATAGSASNATNATNASSASSVDGQTLVNVNVEVNDGTQQTVFSANGVTVTVVCSAGGDPTIDVNGPANTELNWSNNDDGAVDGGLDSNVNNVADVITNSDRGTGTFALATAPPGHTLTGNLGWDAANSHGTFDGCSFWGTLIAT